ncbi:MAG: hypothetical protein JSR79_03115 [Proteobacteria bacterium]|nr:hypothetical protein [Pseudomonadota bacterium]
MIQHFIFACSTLQSRDYEIQHAEYHGEIFGNWTVRFVGPGRRKFAIWWDNRERELMLSTFKGETRTELWRQLDPNQASINEALEIAAKP